MSLTPIRSIVGIAVVFLAFAAVAAGKEVGPAGEWSSSEGAPAWVTAPPAKADAIRVVIANQSNLLKIAEHVDAGYVKRQVAAEVAWRLRSVLAEEADAVRALPWPQPSLVQKGYHRTPAAYTVWTLFEVPSAPVLEAIPAAKRDAARAALALAEPSDTPAWEEMKAPPAWNSEAVVGTDRIPVALWFSADRADVAKAELITLAAGRVESKIVEPLRDLLGSEAAAHVGSVAATWRTCKARAMVGNRAEPTAWALFEVPLARIVAAAPEAKRDAVRAIFAPKPPPK